MRLIFAILFLIIAGSRPALAYSDEKPEEFLVIFANPDFPANDGTPNFRDYPFTVGTLLIVQTCKDLSDKGYKFSSKGVTALNTELKNSPGYRLAENINRCLREIDLKGIHVAPSLKRVTPVLH